MLGRTVTESGVRIDDPSEKAVQIRVGSVSLSGTLVLPTTHSISIIIFAHGSGSSRLSPRNAYVARILQEAGFGTLLFDLLTVEEDEVYETRFNIDLLARRLVEATEWLKSTHRERAPSVAYFGASTGAAAALQASAGRPEVRAVVSRGGRPDLAWNYLDLVSAPTLLIVGGRDEEVIELNKRALAKMRAKEKQLVIVPRATHLFEEAGTLEEVARVARDWFLRFAG
jgi:putative phosphoribosyl transferase